MPMASPREIIASVLRTALRPPETLTVDQWADRYRVLPATGPRPGRWRTITVQYLREPMRDFTTPGVRKIVLRFGTQSAKTEYLLNCLAFSVHRDPYPAMYIMDTIDHARELMKDRILPVFLASPELRGLIPTDRTDKGLLRIRFETMVLYLAGSNSAGNLAFKPVRTLVGDEIDKWPQVLGGRGGTEASALKVAASRQHSYGEEAITILASSPTDEGVGIDGEYAASDRAQYAVPCPHCLHYQVLRFKIDGKGGVRWEGGVGAQMDDGRHLQLREEVKRTAWYECESCLKRIDSSAKPRMIALGVWVRPGQRVVVRDAEALGSTDPFAEGYDLLHPPGVEVVGEAVASSVRGYHIGQLVSPFVTFGEIAEEFVEARGEVDRDFVNQRLGEPWKQPGVRSDALRLIELARRTPEGETSYRRGTVPVVINGPVASGQRAGRKTEQQSSRAAQQQIQTSPGVLALTGTLDIQKDMAYWVVRGWGEQEQSWFIDCGEVPCPEIVDPATGEVLASEPGAKASIQDKARYAEILEDNWAAVEELVQRRFPTTNQTPMEVQYWGIDSGDRTNEVYTFCERIGSRMLAMKGSAQIMTPYRITWQRARDPLTPSDNLPPPSEQLLLFGAHYWKDHVYSHLERRPPMHGAWRYPVDLPEEWARMVTAEHRVVVKSRSRRGAARTEWQLRPGRKDNHYFDCEVMQCAMADFIGMRELTSEPAEPAPRGGAPVLRLGAL